ncbi:hypothetical protein BJY01DRAFT_247713 [Aspergillus pseudoustus]|uniref:Uncharacterized protein n=1 Tax=Aspergillus pseudoustus TaxID=1810923 RepID=A0ABR4JZQ1_9EURO
MRLSAFWATCALPFAAHAVVEDMDSSNTSMQSITSLSITSATSSSSAAIADGLHSLPNAHALVVVSTGIETSTVSLDANEKGVSTTSCFTYTTLITHTYTRTKTSNTDDTSFTTDITSSTTNSPNTSNTGSVTADVTTTVTTDVTTTVTTDVTTAVTTDTTDATSTISSSTTAAEITGIGSSNGSSAAESGAASVSNTTNAPASTNTGTTSNPSTATGTVKPVPGGDTSSQSSLTSSTLVATSSIEDGQPSSTENGSTLDSTTTPAGGGVTVTQTTLDVISMSTTMMDEYGNTLTVPLVISTTIVHTAPDGVTTTDGAGGIVPDPGLTTTTKTETAPQGIVTTTTNEAGIVLPVSGFITTTDGNGGVITVPNGVTSTKTETAPYGIVTTTGLDGGVVTGPGAVTITTDANGIVGTVYPGTTTTDGPITIAPISYHLISSSISSISSDFRKLLPLFTSWEKDPSPPLQTQIISGINGIKGIDDIDIDIKDLFPKLGKGSAPSCPSKRKRGLFDGLLDVVGDAIDTIANTLSCITDNLRRLKTELKGKNNKSVKEILDKLISPDPSPNPPGDNPPENDPSSSTSSSTSSSSCISDVTAHQVTFLCQPTWITFDGSTVSTTTCSPTTTITTNGCSVTDTTTTTTVTETPTPTSTRSDGCAADTCGELCPAEGISGGWITLGPINCARLSTSTVAALPTGSQAAVYLSGSNAQRRDSILVKRVDDPHTDEPLPDLAPGSAELKQYLTEIAYRMARETKWLLYMRVDVRGKWYPFTNARTAAGVGPLYGCTSVFIVTRMGAYLSHIFERPVFIDRDEEGIFETPDSHFRYWSHHALINGGSEFPGVEPIKSLVGTDEQPGPLHYSREPKIFVVTPIEEGFEEGDLQYKERAEELAKEFRDFLYPHGAAPHNEPYKIGYQVVEQKDAENIENPQGKAIVEATPIQFWEQGQNWQLAVGRWRLWVGGKEIVYVDFWDVSDIVNLDNTGGQAAVRVRQLDGHQGVCPASFSSTTTTSSTLVTTTKSSTTSTSTTTTTTKTRPLGHNPPGQPPGFTLPWPHSTTTTATTTTTTTTDLPTPLPATPLDPITCLEDKNINPDPIDMIMVQKLGDYCARGLIGDDLNLGPGSKPVKFDSASPQGFPFYYVEITYVEDCPDRSLPRQNPEFPMAGYTCTSIITEIFKLKTCKTKNGHGGELRVGCLRYMGKTLSKGQRVD